MSDPLLATLAENWVRLLMDLETAVLDAYRGRSVADGGRQTRERPVQIGAMGQAGHARGHLDPFDDLTR
jgi:hypothetical protein